MSWLVIAAAAEHAATMLLFVVLLASFITFWWRNHLRDVYREWKVRRSDDVLDKLIERAEILFMLFGTPVTTELITDANGRHLAIECKKCQQRNRLVSGFRGAKCGKCKTPLVKHEWAQKPQ